MSVPYRAHAETTPVFIWLLACCGMVFVMAVIGAITRLTESGLSITEWNLVTGILPPLGDAAWAREFHLYQQSPEYAAKHFWMGIDDFKLIYFWEWLHRLWGRMIGAVYALPLLWFALRRQIPQGYGWPLLGLLALGGFQGFMGWYMVQSGLVDRPSVSHFRLAAHLGLAFLLFGLLLWLALGLKYRRGALDAPLGWAGLGLLSVTILWGAFVAGLDAGMIYNSFPMMGAGLVPPDFGDPLSSPAGVQFVHRWLAAGTGLVLLGYCWTIRGRAIARWLGGMVLVQIALGITTLLTQVHIIPAALHQGGALILLTLLLIALFNGQPLTKEQK